LKIPRVPPTARHVVLALPLLIFGLARFYQLGAESFWLDEAKGALLALAPFSGWWEELPAHQTPPGHFLLLRLLSLFSIEDGFLRFPSALAGLFSIPLVWWIASQVMRFNQCDSQDVKPSWWVALWFAVAPFHFHFSREARCYTIWLLLELIVVAVLLAQTKHSNSRRLPFLLGLLFPLPLFFHYHAAWFALGRLPWLVMLFLAMTRGGKTQVIVGLMLSSLLTVPFLLHQALSIPPANPNAITGLGELGIGFWLRKSGEIFGFPYPLQVIAVLLVGLAAISLMNRLLPSRGDRYPADKLDKKPFNCVWVLSILVPAVGILATLLLTNRYVAARHFFPVLPLLLIEAGRGLYLLIRFAGGQRAKEVFGILAVLPVIFWGNVVLENWTEVDRPPWRVIAFYLDAKANEQTKFIAVGDNVHVLNYYRTTRGHSYQLFYDTPSGNAEPLGAMGVVLSGKDRGALEWRNGLRDNGRVPEQVWKSKRIAEIEYYSLE